MTTKFKSAVIISATLIIGMVLGSLVTATFLKNRAFDRIAEMRSERGFIKRIEHLIRPDEDQREPVREILANHFEKMHSIGEEMRRNFKMMNDSLIQDLESVLRPEQIERLKKRMRQMKRFGVPPPPHERHDRDRRPPE